MRSSTPISLVVIVAITILAVWMSLVDTPDFFGRTIKAQPGLDIQGGLRVLMEADPGVPVTADNMERAKGIIERRVNALGVAEPVIQVSGTNRIVVELPGVRDPKQAVDLIKQTGLLEFVDFSKSGACTANMPPADVFVFTDAQQRLRGGNIPGVPSATPTRSATAIASVTIGGITATAQATATGSVITLTPPTATNAASATLAPTTALPTTQAASATVAPTETVTPTATTTVEPTKAAMNDTRLMSNRAQATAEATVIAPTTVATAIAATPTASAPTATKADVTAAPTSNASPSAQGPTATPTFARDGTDRDRGVFNPCTGQPFTTIMTGSGLKDANAALSSSLGSQWVINFSIQDNEEGRKFGPFTASHIQQPMAIVIDGRVLSSPVIQSRLDAGGQITGSFTQQQAKDLALNLRYGALPIPLRIVSEEQVGASLGADSVAATGRAGVLSIVIVIIFLIVYYRLPGLLASIALLIFVAVNFALFKFIPVTLTLPALVGFFIGVGNAIDGNVLTFERIKEELRFGRPLGQAVDIGFSRAWPSIRDSNISTALFGFILFFFGGQFGASSVRGFAVTLLLGLALNIFTALFVTRTLLDTTITLFGERLGDDPGLLFRYRK